MVKIKKNQKNFIFLLVFLPVLAIVISAYAVLKGVENYVSTSSYFNIRDVKVDGIADTRYCDVMKEALTGTNIFHIDTLRLSQRIRKKFPTFSSVTVTRVLPSSLWIQAKERIPVAILRRDAAYLFDTDGVVIAAFSVGQSTDFPIIVGLDNQLPNVKVGMSYRLPILNDALALAKAVRLQRFNIESAVNSINKMRVTSIDVSDASNFCFYLGDSIQIKTGRKGFEEKVNLLPPILKSLAGEIENVKYIDLRPKEPAIAMKKETVKP